MIFLGQPYEIINDRFTNKKLYQFDKNGKLEITDEDHILRMKRASYKFKTTEKVEQQNKSIENNTIDENTQNNNDDINKFKCKKCEMIFNNNGALLAHYRTHKNNKGE